MCFLVWSACSTVAFRSFPSVNKHRQSSWINRIFKLEDTCLLFIDLLCSAHPNNSQLVFCCIEDIWSNVYLCQQANNFWMVGQQSYLLLRLEFADTSFNCFSLGMYTVVFSTLKVFKLPVSQSAEVVDHRQMLMKMQVLSLSALRLASWCHLKFVIL